MKQMITTLGALVLIALLTVSCEKYNQPSSKIQGRWFVSSIDMGGTIVPGDGSHLTFMGCGEICKGIDYQATENTFGCFLYTINGDGTLLTICDTTCNGGMYNSSFSIIELNEISLKISAEQSGKGLIILNLSR